MNYRDLLHLSAFIAVLSGAAAQTVDQCASLVNKPLAVTIVEGVPAVTIGLINTCLCVSQIPDFLTTNIVAEAAVNVAGIPATTTALVTLITSSSTYKVCTYPEHASGVCTATNVCAFTCGDGYSVGSNACVCAAPKSECNGQCGDQPSCGSKRAVANDLEGLLRREPQLIKRHPGSEKRELSKAEKKSWKASQGRRVGQRLGCREGWEACGVFGGSRNAWECVDTMNDLESCGGCTNPLLASTSAPTIDDLSTFGTDCTALPGVADVACVRGECSILRCERGWTLSSGGQRCRRIRRTGASGPGHKDADVKAEAYGLEHIPLGSK